MVSVSRFRQCTVVLLAWLSTVACQPGPIEAPGSDRSDATPSALPSPTSAPSAETPPAAAAPVVRALGWVGDEGFYVVRAPDTPSHVVGVRLAASGEKLERTLEVVGGGTSDALARFGDRLIVGAASGDGLVFYATPSAEGRPLPGQLPVFADDGSVFAAFGGDALVVGDGEKGNERRRYQLAAAPFFGFFLAQHLVALGGGLAIVNVDDDRVVADDPGLAAVASDSRRYAAVLQKKEGERWGEGVVRLWDLKTLTRLPPFDVGEILPGADQFDLVFDDAERRLFVVGRSADWREPAQLLATIDLATRSVRRFAGAPSPPDAPATDAVAEWERLAKRFAAIASPPRRIVETKLGPGHNGRAYATARQTIVLFTGEYTPTPYTRSIAHLEIAVLDAANGALRRTLPAPGSATTSYHTVDAELGPKGRFLLLTLGNERTQDFLIDVESGATLNLGDVDPDRGDWRPRWRFAPSGRVLFGDAGVVVLDRLQKLELPTL